MLRIGKRLFPSLRWQNMAKGLKGTPDSDSCGWILFHNSWKELVAAILPHFSIWTFRSIQADCGLIIVSSVQEHLQTLRKWYKVKRLRQVTFAVCDRSETNGRKTADTAIRKESRDCMKHFIIDYEILQENTHLSGSQQTNMLLLFIIFFRPVTFFIRDSIMTISDIDSMILSMIALLPYYYISKKCNCIFAIFITVFLYSVLYSFLISAIVSPLAIFTENKIFHYIHIIANPFIINVFLTYGFLIYLMKHPRRF